MIEHVLRAARAAGAELPIVVVPADDPELERHLQGRAVAAVQPQPRGTGDALLAARAALGTCENVLVLPADMPLVSYETVTNLLAAHRASGAAATVLTALARDPSSYGRIERDATGRLIGIVEAADDSRRTGPAEVNGGLYVFSLPELWEVLSRISTANSQQELYLSWVPQNHPGEVCLVHAPSEEEVLQVNDRVQLAAAEAAMRQRTLRRLMLSGVTVVDPGSTWVDCEVQVGRDTTIHPGTVLRGATKVGERCELGPFAELDSCEIGDGCRIGRSVLRGCKLDDEVDVGPFNRVRPGTQLGRHSHLGTFTEVVRSRIGVGSQVPHLSYVGDAELGDDVNVGAGTITANFDGRAKHRTVVEDGARLGSDTILVAPIRVGKGAYTGAGSVLTSDVPDGALGVARSPQRNLPGWSARRRPDTRPVADVAREEEG